MEKGVEKVENLKKKYCHKVYEAPEETKELKLMMRTWTKLREKFEDDIDVNPLIEGINIDPNEVDCLNPIQGGGGGHMAR